MEEVLVELKREQLTSVGLHISGQDRISASMRRPFKKGARQYGGSSRSDETSVTGVTGFGELFLKILYEVEQSIADDSRLSPQGLVEWNDAPSSCGEVVDLMRFFRSGSLGQIGLQRPRIERREGSYLVGRWPRSKRVYVAAQLRISPLWCYSSGLYLAEGTTAKSKLFSMYVRPESGFGLGFTASDNASVDIMLRALSTLFRKTDILTAWKVKVGSQYFPELAVIGMKNTVPMLRGGASGDGKLRTMEISLAIRDWALAVVPALTVFDERYSHVEPTGAGLPRVDFWASSALCKWYFPLVLYGTFGPTVDPLADFHSE